MNTDRACEYSSTDNLNLSGPSAARANDADVRAPSAPVVSGGGSAVVSISPDQRDMTPPMERIASIQPSEAYL